MSNEFPGDLYGRILEENLGLGYFELTVHLVEMRLLAEWLVTQSCFYIVLPMPENEFTIVVKSEMRHLLIREHNAQLANIREAFESSDYAS